MIRDTRVFLKIKWITIHKTIRQLHKTITVRHGVTTYAPETVIIVTISVTGRNKHEL